MALEVEIENVGLLPGTNVAGTLTVPVPSQGFDTLHDFGTIASGGTATGTFVFVRSGACGEEADLVLDLTADGGYAASVPIPFALGLETVFFEEDFDAAGTLPGGWGDASTGPGGSGWVIDGTSVNSSPNAVFASNPSKWGSSTLTTPPIALGESAGTLSFAHFYDTEANWDGGVLEINVDGGGWQDILDAGGAFESGGYNLALSGNNNPLEGRSGWSGNSGGFITTVVTMPPAAANASVQLRWVLGHDTRVGATGWFIDDISLTQFSCDESGPLITLSSSDLIASEYLGAADAAEITASTVLPVPASIPVTLEATGTADAALDLSGFSNLVLSAGTAATTASLLAVSDGLVEGPETLTVTSAEAVGSVPLEILDHPYAQWAASNLGTSGSVGAFEDFDDDGFLNIEELVNGTDAADAGSIPQIGLHPEGTDFKIPVALAGLPAGVLVNAECSADLITWSTGEVTLLPDGFLVPGDATRLFARLKYRLQPTAP